MSKKLRRTYNNTTCRVNKNKFRHSLIFNISHHLFQPKLEKQLLFFSTLDPLNHNSSFSGKCHQSIQVPESHYSKIKGVTVYGILVC